MDIIAIIKLLLYNKKHSGGFMAKPISNFYSNIDKIFKELEEVSTKFLVSKEAKERMYEQGRIYLNHTGSVLLTKEAHEEAHNIRQM